MKKLFRTLFLLLGIVSLALTITLCFQIPLVTAILPPEDTFPLHIFIASITASITASLLWIGVSGELGAVKGGAIDLVVFYGGLTIFQFRSAQHTLAGVLLCIIAVIVSLGFFLRFRRFPIEDNRLMPLPVRISFGIFFLVLLLVESRSSCRYPMCFHGRFTRCLQRLWAVSFLVYHITFCTASSIPVGMPPVVSCGLFWPMTSC